MAGERRRYRQSAMSYSVDGCTLAEGAPSTAPSGVALRVFGYLLNQPVNGRQKLVIKRAEAAHVTLIRRRVRHDQHPAAKWEEIRNAHLPVTANAAILTSVIDQGVLLLQSTNHVVTPKTFIQRSTGLPILLGQSYQIRCRWAHVQTREQTFRC